MSWLDSRCWNTVCATILYPASFGCIISGRLSVGIVATHVRMKGMSDVFVSRASAGYISANAVVYSAHKFVDICMPPMTTSIFFSCIVVIISRRFCARALTGTP